MQVDFYFEVDYSQEVSTTDVHQKYIYRAKDRHWTDFEYVWE